MNRYYKQTSVPADTTRLTVQIDIPYDSDIMNYGEVTKRTVKDYINNNEFSVILENGPNTNYEFKGE
jgi:hypothetical protein